jgi:hypothetical protein
MVKISEWSIKCNKLDKDILISNSELKQHKLY